MASLSPSIDALAHRQRMGSLADAALFLSAGLFVTVCLHLADASALRRIRPPEEPIVLSTGTEVAGLPASDMGTAVIDGAQPDPAPRPTNDLQRRCEALRGGLTNAVSGRSFNELAYVSLPAAMSMVDGECFWERSGSAALAISEEGIVRFVPDTSKAVVNGEAIGIPGAARRLREELYIPAKALATLYGARLTKNETTGTISVEARGKQFTVVSEQVFRMEICREGRWLRVFYVGKLAKEYPICSGAGDNTPVGHFHIQNKAMWPSWRAYWGEYMPGGSARNPLGARWLGTTARGRVTGWPIGIHGTNDPSSIGRRISGGCIRTYNENAIELYDTIPIGTPVWIHE
jgi:lipoprotein-anchoring transpeptidase ErfK/SrfK